LSRSSSRGSNRSRGRSGSSRLFLLTASGQGQGDQGSSENRLVHEISLSTRFNENQIFIESGIHLIAKIIAAKSFVAMQRKCGKADLSASSQICLAVAALRSRRSWRGS
jgi:hypothetical protein